MRQKIVGAALGLALVSLAAVGAFASQDPAKVSVGSPATSATTVVAAPDEADGANQQTGVDETDGSNHQSGVDEAEGANHQAGVDEADGANR